MGFLLNKLNPKATSCLFLALWFFCLFFGANSGLAQTDDELKEDLRQQISEMQKQIDDYRASISDLQAQNKTLKNEISLLDKKIKATELEIKQTDLTIKKTESEIKDKDSGIAQAQIKLDRERGILGEYVRLVNEYDQHDMVESLLSEENLSEVFARMATLESVQENIQESMNQIRGLKVDLTNDKEALEDRREELNGLKSLQQLQKKALIKQEKDKNNLLTQTKGQESSYQKLLSKTKSDVEAIRNQLYLLEGVGLSLPLMKAYEYAKKASDLTGVRPAFLLALLKQESSWGEKVGTGTWKKDMHTRDQKAFVQICEELGREPNTTPVSRKPSYGWGGAMGPAQFLPSVWLSYRDQIAQLTGHNPPDPWDIGDAFVGAAVKLAQGGANAQTRDAEWKAAQIYFAGSRWNNKTYYFYGDSVMEMAAVIQEQLNLIVK